VSGCSTIKRPARGFRSAPSRCALALVAAALVASGCSSGKRLDQQEPSANFTVAVPSSSFPASQLISEPTHLVLVVQNMSAKPIPNLSVTICNKTCAYPSPPGEGTSVQAFSVVNRQPYEANPSKPVWVIDRPPGVCTGQFGYSCAGGSFGADTTVDANTWALGHPLKPGGVAKFDWAVTPVTPGQFVVAWEVSAGLAGKAKAVLSDGSLPHGSFPVTLSAQPSQQTVNNNGQIVSAPSPQNGG
jgi:hypothetical protein